MFEFSFDTVRLLQNNGLSYTDPASNSFGGFWPVTTPPLPTTVNCNSTCATGTIASDHATITWNDLRTGLDAGGVWSHDSLRKADRVGRHAWNPGAQRYAHGIAPGYNVPLLRQIGRHER